MNLTFVLPERKHKEDVLNFYAEFEKSGKSCIGCANGNDFEKWLVEMTNRHLGKDLPQGYVKENFYLCYDKAELVGVFSLKFELTEYLYNFGGHIGYAVAPHLQNKGYATQILKQGCEIAKNLGFDKILLVCNEDNIASEKVIVKNGGVYVNSLFDKEENVEVKRYLITL